MPDTVSPDSIAFDPDSLSVSPGHFIGGRFVEIGAERIPVRRPSDGAVMGEICDGGEEAVAAATAAAKQALAESGWANMVPRQRARVLKRFADLLAQNAEPIARLESAPSTRVITESRARDVTVLAETVRFYAEYADKVDGAVTPTGPDVLSLTVSEPHGIVAAITPWNFPLILSSWKLGPALAAGNAVILKPSEMTPYSIVEVARLAVEAGVPAGLFNIVHGRGGTTGAALVSSPDTHYVTFTGSTATGAAIMAGAAQAGLKPVSLELGGKGPQLVFADAPSLDRTADMIARGFTYNSGQVCFAGSRLVVDRKVQDDLLDRVMRRIATARPGPTWSTDTTLPPIISDGQADRIDRLVRTTVDEGADLLTGGKPIAATNAARFYEPTILGNVMPSMTGFKEEVFGPVLAVQPFDDPEEGLALADHPVYGLSASVHTSDLNRALAAARSVQAGTVWVNSFGRGADMTSPFGGYKSSGLGKDMGRDGFVKYLKQKSVWIETA